MQSLGRFTLGQYQIWVDEQCVVLKEKRITVQPKVMELLSLLANRYPAVVSRTELIDELWAGNEAVGEKALTNTIWQMRQLFSQPQCEIQVVETIRKKGYKLAHAPQRFDENDPSPLSPLSVPASSQSKHHAYFGVCVAIVTAFLVWMIVDSQTKANLYRAKHVTQITKMPGSELRPTPAPSGEQLVFVWQRPGLVDQLFLKDLSQPDLPLKQLTFSQKRPWKAVWSPDQRHLYFAQKDEAECEIVRLTLANLEQVKLAECPLNSGYNYIAISPDGNTLAFNGQAPEHSLDGIYLLDLSKAGTTPERLSCLQSCDGRDRDVAFSPDGKTLAITQRLSSSLERLTLFDLQQKTYEIIDDKHADIVGMSFHPNGKRLVYAAQVADKRLGFWYELADKTRHEVNHRGFSYPHYDEQGNIYYQRRREVYYIANFDTASQVASVPKAIVESHYSNQYPSLSAQHQKLAFLSNESGHYELWLSNADGSAREQLTQLTRNLRYPIWSLDGNKLLVVSADEPDGHDKLYVYDHTSKELKRYDLMLGKIGRPFWHGNGNDVIVRQVTESQSDLFSLSLSDFTLSRLTNDGARFGQFVDSNTFFYENSKGLWRSEAGNVEAILARTEFSTRYSWVVMGNVVFYKSNEGQYSELRKHDYITKVDSPLLRLPTDSFSKEMPLVIDKETGALFLTLSLTPQSDINRLEF
ncbi:hypothetical protein PALB_9710 [Pseudoalteromonas luteoviolacea B = ATCC 29581]|nr:hypothetical protein PALB_9710 [Pseudoalteromonas luteoviolacea B = ATCC 29581]